MRGKRTNVSKKKIDLVLVAARFSPDGRRLTRAQGYQRHGVVWADLRLFDRQELLERLRAGARVATGRPGDLAGDFELIAKVRLAGKNGDAHLIAEGQSSQHDDLGLPLF